MPRPSYRRSSSPTEKAPADQVHSLLDLALIVAEGTGRRISAWCNLRWDDVDIDRSTIRWRAETDKTGYEQIVPMTETVNDETPGLVRDAANALEEDGASERDTGAYCDVTWSREP